ncbi:MAG: excinuclease ABC subunit B [Spirochaetes bacterium GWF1_41_5]|nr:MAG: excinuclease ABC subunit B [Spirochaetes bacterium GWF1_41_5]HBE03595.1 excinuclease ABC subunit B [Spirochaetia bacterium]
MFRVKETYKPSGDQPGAIASAVNGLNKNFRYQTILGATGTGKTFTAAKIIEAWQRPVLVVSHNKTLAAQLYREFCGFFPDNAVEYFVSYYDYYQPEAYVVKKDLYIEKDSAINAEIEKLRLRATSALMERKDVIIVASVSCIYGLGSPEDYREMYIALAEKDIISRKELLYRLIDIHYQRNDNTLERGGFRVRGDVIEIVPAYSDVGIRLEFFGDEIERISEIDVLNMKVTSRKEKTVIYPARHFVMPLSKLNQALPEIEKELTLRLAWFEEQGKTLEKERLRVKTGFDLEMLRETGFCPGIENYSRQLSGRKAGDAPYTLLDYFPKDFLVIIDESHVTIPQMRGMYHGDQARKKSLVDYGFRLPSALDNRPLFFEEFLSKTGPILFISATPGAEELAMSQNVAEQINRPTGLLDPVIEVRPEEGQIDDLIGEINKEISGGFRVLVTTLTKKMSEDLTKYLSENGIRVRYLHSEIDTIERVEILKNFRAGEFDVLVGINLLREGLDLPEVSLVAILDADKTGFLRSRKSLLQTAGRAARNLHGRVIMYATRITDAMKECMDETDRRRKIQQAFNEEHGITPKTIIKPVEDIIERETDRTLEETARQKMASSKNRAQILSELETEMELAADLLDFERAIEIRDLIKKLSI